KFTVSFQAGLNAFSLPLQPFHDAAVSFYVSDIPNVTYMRWLDTTGQWITHYKGMGVGVNDVSLEISRGYEIFLASETRYTFWGYPATMIRYMEGFGDSPSFRTGLSAEKSGNNVVLNWSSIATATEYQVFRSAERNGLNSFSLQPFATVPSSQMTITDIGILSNEGEYYYLVVPVNVFGGLGSSTYSVGVVTVEYDSGSDTFGLPLMVDDVQSLDWYCDEIPNVVGMSYLTYGLWKYHSREMPEKAYDVDVQQAVGYQISTDGPARFTFIGY
ncbi:MAG: hypothetical protein KAW09_09345, partial [Thermoplasmata archaeon]|nr:hypothetical protein [Thermoplasmata archaeon]